MVTTIYLGKMFEQKTFLFEGFQINSCYPINRTHLATGEAVKPKKTTGLQGPVTHRLPVMEMMEVNTYHVSNLPITWQVRWTTLKTWWVCGICGKKLKEPPSAAASSAKVSDAEQRHHVECAEPVAAQLRELSLSLSPKPANPLRVAMYPTICRVLPNIQLHTR